MNFCKKCGSVCVPKKEGGKVFLVCRRCGHEEKDFKTTNTTSKTVRKENPMTDDVVVISEKKEAMPKTRAICGKCGNKEAFWRMQQMRSSDEPPTIFYTCTKCKHTWRKY